MDREGCLAGVCRGVCPELLILRHQVTRTKRGHRLHAHTWVLSGYYLLGSKRQKKGDQAEGDQGIARSVTKREQAKRVAVNTDKPVDIRQDQEQRC